VGVGVVVSNSTVVPCDLVVRVVAAVSVQQMPMSITADRPTETTMAT